MCVTLTILATCNIQDLKFDTIYFYKIGEEGHEAEAKSRGEGGVEEVIGHLETHGGSIPVLYYGLDGR